MASFTLILAVVIGILAYVFMDHNAFSIGLPPWPLFKIATNVGNFFRNGVLASNPGALLLSHHGIAYTAPSSIYAIAKLGVADIIKDDLVDINYIAAKVGAKPDKLFRIIRYLSTEGIFIIKGDKIGLTPSGQFLRSDRDDSMKWCMIHWNEEAVETMREMEYELTTGEDAFVKKFGKDLFSIYEERPSSAEAFTKCMRGLFSGINPAVAIEYDFSKHNVLLDLGGGMGYFTREIIKQHGKSITKPNSKLSKAIVFDLQKIITHANHSYNNNDIIEYKSGSFFDLETIPRGADVIVINGVLHDWNDKECIQILTNAAKVLPPNGLIIISDMAIPDSPSHPLYNPITRLDAFMMTISSGYFRTFPEYKEVWDKSNLILDKIIPTRSLNSLWILKKKE